MSWRRLLRVVVHKITTYSRRVERSVSVVETSSRQARYIGKIISINAAFRLDPSLTLRMTVSGVAYKKQAMLAASAGILRFAVATLRMTVK